MWAPPALFTPESVTIHEAGHQFWYGLVATNEFEEPWLDEGFNRYHDRKAYNLAYGARGLGERYFGLPGRGVSGWPVVAPGVAIRRGEDIVGGLRQHGRDDVMARRSWDFASAAAYGVNAYGKPALSLQTLEGLIGDETMTRVMRTYARRYRFAHPTSADFIATVNEVTGQDWRWYFDQTWFSAEECDYSVEVKVARAVRPQGFLDESGPRGRAAGRRTRGRPALGIDGHRAPPRRRQAAGRGPRRFLGRTVGAREPGTGNTGGSACVIPGRRAWWRRSSIPSGASRST